MADVTGRCVPDRRIWTLVVKYCAKIVWFSISSERLETEYKNKAAF